MGVYAMVGTRERLLSLVCPRPTSLAPSLVSHYRRAIGRSASCACVELRGAIARGQPSMPFACGLSARAPLRRTRFVCIE